MEATREVQTREGRAEEIVNGEKLIIKTPEGYRVPSQREADRYYLVAKKNGKITCDCQDYISRVNGENGESETPSNGNNSNNGRILYCKHIIAVFKAVKIGQIAIEKSPTTAILEYPFSPSQIQKKGNLDYIEGAAVIQRMNDASLDWSFEILDTKTIEDEVIVKGRLTVYINGREIVREHFGGATFTRTRDKDEIVSRSDTFKSAVTDCIKKTCTTLGIGLHLYSEGNRYLSFQSA